MLPDRVRYLATRTHGAEDTTTVRESDGDNRRDSGRLGRRRKRRLDFPNRAANRTTTTSLGAMESYHIANLSVETVRVDCTRSPARCPVTMVAATAGRLSDR